MRVNFFMIQLAFEIFRDGKFVLKFLTVRGFGLILDVDLEQYSRNLCNFRYRN